MQNPRRHDADKLAGTGTEVYIASEVDAMLDFLGAEHEKVSNKLIASRKKLQARVQDIEVLQRKLARAQEYIDDLHAGRAHE